MPKQKKSIRQITQEVMERASTQYINMASTLEKGKMPRSFSKNRLITSDIYWWCSGFYPGTLGIFMSILVLKI